MVTTQEAALLSATYPNVRDVVQRRNALMAMTINRGVGLQNSVSTMCAMEYLHSEGVPRQIAQRVLSQPNKRRSLT
ncbi:MAG: hypothetical protein V4447_11820 [Pseudomonadota bacterium]